jgi:hypothetical protein
MPKKNTDVTVLERFESALRKALSTPPGAARKKARSKRKKKS